MAILKFRRKRALRRRAAAPPLPETVGLSGAARRVNRFVAVVTLFGAFGAVALAVALTPGAQTSASSAVASQAESAISEIKGPPPVIVEASVSTPEVAAPPQRANKSDQLSRISWSPQPASLDLTPDPEPPSRPAANDEASERIVAMAPTRPDTANLAVPAGEPEVEARYESEPSMSRATYSGTAEIRDEVFGEALEAGVEAAKPSPIEPRAQPTAEAIDVATTESIDLAALEPGDDARDEIPLEEAAPEPAVVAALEPAIEAAPETVTPSRTAAVTTDVNMRSEPDNGAKSIVVVPNGKKVEVFGCDYWCEVIYAGQRGYIYKGFLPGTGSLPATRKASLPATEEAPLPAATVVSSAPSPNRVRMSRQLGR